MAKGKAPIWVRLLRVYHEKGPGGVWFGTLSLVGYRRLALLARRLAEPITPVLPRTHADVRLLRREDEAAFEGLGQGDAGLFRRRFDAGHQCWGAWCSGRLRHVAWLAFRETHVEYLRCRLVLDPDIAYVYRAYTEPHYRRLGLGPATQSACLQSLREKGTSLVLAAVVPDNPWAFPPWLSVGYRRIALVRALGTGPRPRVAVTLDPGGAPGGWRFERYGGEGPTEADAPA